ncbi:MAG TPA: hypothetical protein V6D12_08825 [Candidatus Obscuribacterales bacterium]
MRDPFWRLKLLPWRSLLQVAVLTNLLVIAVELFLTLGYVQFAVVRQAIFLLYRPPLGILIIVALAIGIGAIAVYILERWYQEVIINTSILWALVLCLAVLLLVKSLLLGSSFLGSFDEIQLMAIIVGIFWKGRPYWR